MARADEIRAEYFGGALPHTKRLLIFFLPGNPGVVRYYGHFLADLHNNLVTENLHHFDIITTYGHSHPGFELGDPSRLLSPPITGGGPPYNLKQQIEGTIYRLKETARAYAGGDDAKYEPLKVVLVGHSVGSYMLMEIVDWWQKQQALNKPGDPRNVEFQLVGGVCLFPTVVDLVKSPRGKIMKVSRPHLMHTCFAPRHQFCKSSTSMACPRTPRPSETDNRS